ncbi:MAG: ribonuclease P protein subunit [Nanoarchaeota archaeon]|nr:ribonuclease P protein subunit [Nanoarchaeota archaeon]
MEKKAYRKPLIGKTAKVEYHNKTFSGRIIDETKNTILFETENKKIIKLNKSSSQIMINNIAINGKNIQKRPEERIKR